MWKVYIEKNYWLHVEYPTHVVLCGKSTFNNNFFVRVCELTLFSSHTLRKKMMKLFHKHCILGPCPSRGALVNGVGLLLWSTKFSNQWYLVVLLESWVIQLLSLEWRIIYILKIKCLRKKALYCMMVNTLKYFSHVLLNFTEVFGSWC